MHRFRVEGAGGKLREPILSNQLLLQKIAEEMSETFENVGYGDVARNFAIELEFKDPPIF